MVTSVRLWNPTALPRLIKKAMSAMRSNIGFAQDERKADKEKGFFESYEKMMESHAILILGLHNKRW